MDVKIYEKAAYDISPMLVPFLEDNGNILVEDYGTTEEEVEDTIKALRILCGMTHE